MQPSRHTTYASDGANLVIINYMKVRLISESHLYAEFIVSQAVDHSVGRPVIRKLGDCNQPITTTKTLCYAARCTPDCDISGSDCHGQGLHAPVKITG